MSSASNIPKIITFQSITDIEDQESTDGYEEIGLNRSYTDGRKSKRPSAFQLIGPRQGPSRTLWSEIPEVQTSGILGKLAIVVWWEDVGANMELFLQPHWVQWRSVFRKPNLKFSRPKQVTWNLWISSRSTLWDTQHSVIPRFSAGAIARPFSIASCPFRSAPTDCYVI